ncbi:MAG: hypothetical protein BWK72_16320 [Rhodoferax ferrireducens]|uniref:Uncharacterized protein n=1 Tax=Rhodoferax ferrireducens TaxID=192843 RepID=A0A1W9KQT9_9BURK|nr:MAG: hypothetical protein BWK72_16320 [Rhodoferax ferrireducens]
MFHTSKIALCAAIAAAFSSSVTMAQTLPSLSQLGGTYFHDKANGFNAEIAAFDTITSTLWVSGVTGVDVLNVTSSGLSFNSRIDLSAFGAINSVAIHNGVAAFALENTTNRELPGIVQFYDTSTRSLTSGTNTVTVGSLPDMLTFSADGSKLLVANEATPSSYPSSTNPVGGVSIINMANRSVTTVNLSSSIPTTGTGMRSGLPFDYEPEYIAINKAGTQAWVTLQEHNAIATLDLASNQFTGITGLGLKDYSLPQNAIDSTDRPGPGSKVPVPPVIAQMPQALKGAYQPDAIATYEVGGQTFLVMANEGDAQENDGDVARASTIAGLGLTGDAGRTNVIRDLSSPGNLVTMGGRSFSIRDADGNIVFDSGNILEAQAIAKGIYDDGRSDDKGVEPEGVALQTIGGRTFAFIGLERTTSGAVGVFDITDPANASFVDMIVTPGTERPEGLTTFVKDNMVYLAIANEGDDGLGMSTAVYSLAPVPEPETWAMLLAGLGLLGLRARRKQPV